jgi:MFS family permease
LDPYASFRSRDYRFLLIGNSLSAFGLQMLSLAVSWDLYVQTRSPIVLGNIGLVQVAPFLFFALAAGHFADRVDRRRILLITQTLLILSSAILSFGAKSVPLIYTCLFLTATARAFQGPARQAMVSHVVPLEALANAITWNSSAFEIANVSGPALAGLLLATMGSRTVYLVQLGLGIVTLVCFERLSIRLDASREIPPGGKALLEGVRFVRHNKLLLPAMSLDLFAVLFGGATALLPIFAIEVLHVGAQGFGWLRAAPSIGAVSMALLQAHTHQSHKTGRVLLWSVAGFGVATVVFGFSRSYGLSFAALVVIGAMDNISVVLRQSLLQMNTPDHLRGRVLAVNNIFISCSNQLGAVESGWTAAWFGPVGSVVGGGLATIAVVASFAAKSSALRKWRL